MALRLSVAENNHQFEPRNAVNQYPCRNSRSTLLLCLLLIPRPYKPAVFALSTQGLDNRPSNFTRSSLTSSLDYEYWAANFVGWQWDQWLTSPARTMPIDGHSYLTKRGWAGKGSGLRAGSVARPIVASQKRDSKGLGKDRDDHFEFWDQYVIPLPHFPSRASPTRFIPSIDTEMLKLG